jgi:hypothetical protein
MRSRVPVDIAAKHALAAAARPVLVPLGLKQKGHSRHWIADCGCWIVIVEFEPAGFFAKVGAQFLWSADGHLLFDYGLRIGGLTVEDLARRAGDEAAAIRQKFASVSDIARHFAASPSDEFWPLYHRAVATALAGEVDAALPLFARLAEKPAMRDWQQKLQADASGLARHLPDQAAFRAAIAAVIDRARALHGLPAGGAW